MKAKGKAMKKRRYLLVGPLLLVVGITLILTSQNMINADVPFSSADLISAKTEQPAMTEAAGSMNVLGYVFAAAGAVVTIAIVALLF